jgi:predicted anti-sigma-YlaC factor YlaD
MTTGTRPHLRLVTSGDPAAPPVPRRPRLLPAAIAAVGVAQVGLGLLQVTGFSPLDVLDGGHIGNESAAWNVAIGVALLGIARLRRCPTAVLIMLTAFLGTLTVVTLSDVLDGRVGPARIATHLLAATGYALVLYARRAAWRPTGRNFPGTTDDN